MIKGEQHTKGHQGKRGGGAPVQVKEGFDKQIEMLTKCIM